MRASRLDQLWSSIADAGREFVRRRLGSRRRPIGVLCRDLLSVRGEASTLALAREVLEAWRAMSEAERREFFLLLAREFGPDIDAVKRAAEAYAAAPGPRTLAELRRVSESPRLELFRRLNTAPGGPRTIVEMRALLLRWIASAPELAELDADLHHLLASWFNPGFLTLTRIDWGSPASLLEKLKNYEKVHQLRALEDFKRRLAKDRRCFAFFHPVLPDEPLIFVQIALTSGLADRIQPLIDPSEPVASPADADTAIFYSISNCQEGLRGVTLGNFLIKLVVATLQSELPHIATFATLSPVPGFARWLEQTIAENRLRLSESERGLLERLADPDWHEDPATAEALRPLLTALCAWYLVRARRNGRPIDPVARFHLGNGARLERVNWLADLSRKGLAESYGIMVNYAYDPSRIEQNHELYVEGEVVHARAVEKLVTAAARLVEPVFLPVSAQTIS
ncbi:MAG: malonyl-CoA decarboxylase [Geminicoccaceae bacterium]|nr:malonyl-CoA decarboxylase [Geminicoccaceae bacterium]MCS7266863.1 malonyl-CoA decarboxylase [Geminicoccaceae bacterium]MCX7628873.1 malonyl-CoA decarboxylase [Geminicoccaceae bacterium]MDW8124214.1 malonyl-CoA decarboxylase [Geminicoccaceae bacterium]MDW8340563.1 malonyl-CoA decarboxylase [Geminicoccaceae bacterium]